MLKQDMPARRWSAASDHDSRLRRPDDWHLHLRDGAALRAVLPFTAARFARAIVMPNLKPPVTTTAQALAYRQRILAALPAGARFEPLMTLYLTDRTDPAEVDRAQGERLSCTASSSTRPAPPPTPTPASPTSARIDAVLGAHGASSAWCCRCTARSPTRDVDVFDREARFIDDGARAARRRASRACASCSSTSPRAQRREFVRGARAGIARHRSPRSTC